MGFVIPGQLASKSLSVEGERPLLTLSGDANRDNLTGLQLSKQDTLGQRILDFPLNRATQRARAEDRIKAHVGQQLASLIRQLQAHILRLHPLGQLRDHQVDDASNLRLRQRREHDRVVDAVEELGTVPRFVVMMMTVFLKSTLRPCESVRRPSSRIWSSELKMSG